MVICIVERRKKSIGYLLFLNAIMHSKVMHVHFFFFFFSAIFAGLRFVEIQKCCYHGHVTLRNDFSRFCGVVPSTVYKSLSKYVLI